MRHRSINRAINAGIRVVSAILASASFILILATVGGMDAMTISQQVGFRRCIALVVLMFIGVMGVNADGED